MAKIRIPPHLRLKQSSPRSDNPVTFDPDEREADACTREDFYLYVQRAFFALEGQLLEDNWHIEAVCRALQQCYEGRRTRQIINLPPRHLKSLICSVFFTTWVLGHDPRAKILCVSYGENLVKGFSEHTHRLMQTQFYRRLFPRTIVARHDRLSISTTAGGYRRAVSTAGALTGHGADYIILDDPTKADDAFSPNRLEAANRNFNHTISTRLNQPRTGKIIVVMQRLAEDDLTGHLLRQGGWNHLAIPLVAEHPETYQLYHGVRERAAGDILHPARVGAAEIARLRLNEMCFQSQYQQNPQACSTSRIFSTAWFRYFGAPPPSEKNRHCRCRR